MDGPQTRALADYLSEWVTGKVVERIDVPEDRWQANMMLLNCVGQVIQRVRSHGKWLFFDFSHGVTWGCQLITRAKWRVEKAGNSEFSIQNSELKERSKGRRVPLIAVAFRGGVVAVLTGHPAFFILPTERVRGHAEIKALGPDPLVTATFYDDFPYRLRQTPGRTVAAALLDQEVVAGLGNMLKCEILYAMRFSPSVRVGALMASQVDHLAGTIVGMTATAMTFAARGEGFPHRVFDRAGMGCGVCGAEILVDRSGQDGHLTWWCGGCQPVGVEPGLF